VDGPAFQAAAASAFGGLPGGAGLEVAMEAATFTGSDKRLRFDSHPLASVAIAFEGAASGSADVVPLAVMAAYLGEIDALSNPIAAANMTSKLAMDQGEQAAANNFKVINTSYKDSGLFGIYFTCPDNRCDDAMFYSLWNLVRLVHKTSDADVEFAKTQLKAKLVKDLSTTSGLANDLAKSLSCYGRAVGLPELFARIDAVDAATVKATAKKVINDNDHALAASGPIYELPDYNWIRRRSHWLRY